MAWGRKQSDDRNNEPVKPEDQPIDEGGGGADEGAEETQKLIAKLQAERDDLNQRYLRTLADYQNSQRRAAGNEREAKQQGITAITLNILPVLDHFDLALNQDTTKVSAQQIVSGVRVIRDELMKVLQTHGINVINPQPDDEFDPTKHQAVVQARDTDIRPGHIAATLQTGYALNDRIIRPAMVSVRPPEDNDPHPAGE